MRKSFKILGIAASLCAAMLATGCNDDNVEVNAVQPANAQGQTVTQVEFLARPAINEGLFVSNKLLNLYNSIGPDFQARALQDGTTEHAAAADLLNAGVGALNVLITTGNNLGLDPIDDPNTIVGALLPDVMRIDTDLDRQSTNGGDEVSAYASAVNAKASPVAGRKLTDDVVDVTLSLLLDGNRVLSVGELRVKDNVPYYKPTGESVGANNPNIGHQRLHGQEVDYGTSSFPYLARPN